MPKPFALTKRGEISEFLRNHPGEPYTTTELAERFGTSMRNIQGFLLDLEDYGWSVRRFYQGPRKVFFMVWPPKPFGV